MAIENEAGFMSLADLAALETDEIETLMSRVPDEGIFIVRGKEVTASEAEAKEEGQPPLFSFRFAMEILEAEPLEKDKDPEKYVGRTLTERYTLWPSDFKEAIGLLKGRYQIIKLPNTGALGGVEGSEPGWLDGMVSHTWKVRVRHFKDKNKNIRAGFDWLPMEEDKEEEAA